MDIEARLPSPFMAIPYFPFDGKSGGEAICGVRIFGVPNLGADQTTAVVTNYGRNDNTFITNAATTLAGRIVKEFEIEPTRFTYIEYYPATSETLIQERLIAPATPARFARVRFDYDQDNGFTRPRRELIELPEVAFLTNTPVDSWQRELEESAACNRLYAMLGELGPSRVFELIERALQRQSEEAAKQAEEGAAHGYGADVWERVREAVVQLILCAERAVLPEGELRGSK